MKSVALLAQTPSMPSSQIVRLCPMLFPVCLSRCAPPSTASARLVSEPGEPSVRPVAVKEIVGGRGTRRSPVPRGTS